MSSDIQFGELEYSEPQKGVRPDRDAHYCVVPVGEIGMPDAQGDPKDDLLIFVDLDVMRDMEAHAESDTSVELGGVMLGHQLVDEQGRPYVVITDCLRAEHYHATKGSFKFTHDTWSQITERRKQHHPDLEMVGWYHTHPGWTVFLSGMDLFICNNFFNKPQDVALVIDPVNDDRGWFQWTSGASPVTRPTQGFYLMTNKYRQSELKYFSRLYSKGLAMNDPRYSDSFGTGSSPVVNISDNRRPLFDLAIIAMLTFQFMVLALLAWKLLASPAEETAQRVTSKSSIEEARDSAYREILRAAVAADGQDPGLVEKYTSLKSDNQRLLSNLDGQMVRAEQYSEDLETTRSSLELRNAEINDLNAKLTLSETEKEQIRKKLATYEKSSEDSEVSGEQQKSVGYLWWLISGGILAIGTAVGFALGLRRGETRAFDELGYSPADEKMDQQADDGERIQLSLNEEESS